MDRFDIKRAVALHQRGHLIEAEQQYRGILKVIPDDFDALHLLGVLRHQQGRNIEALELISRALQKNPNHVLALTNCGVVLTELKRFKEARSRYKKAIALKPDFAEGYYNLGVVNTAIGQLHEALASYEKAIRFKPDHFEALNNQGNLLRQLRCLDQALLSYARAIALNPTYAEAYYNRGVTLRELKRLDEALASCEKAIALKPDYAAAFHCHGNIYAELNRFKEAVVSYQSCIRLDNASAEAFNNLGSALRELNRLDEALASYDRAISVKQDYVQAFNNRGVVLHELERFDEALASYDKAIALKPDYTEAIYSRAATLESLRRFDDALAGYDHAITQNKNYAPAFYGRGNTLRQLKRLDEALASYERAITLNSAYFEAHINRGVLLFELMRFSEALTSYEHAIALVPNSAEAFCNRGNALKEIGRFDEAINSYDKAIALNPASAEAFNNRGNALANLKRFDEAFANYASAIALSPDYVEAWYNQAIAFADHGSQARAVTSLERALELKPDNAVARLALCTAQLPILYSDPSEIEERRAAYREKLKAFSDFSISRGAADLSTAVGTTQPFFLAYQGLNDRDLQALYGSIVCKIMARQYPAATLATPPRSNEPIRVGIVSGFFRHHSNWKVPIWGWLSQIDRQRFTLLGYHTGATSDVETRKAKALCDRFVEGPLSTDHWRQAILSDAPHILIFPEVGMDPLSVKIAAQRLAPVQCNSWGHPDTSGLPTLDYFLSSDLMEIADAQDHYTESLVRLPNLSIYYEALDLPPVMLNRADLGLSSSATVFWSGQSLFKYLPQFDEVFPRIARAIGNCQFVFVQHESSYINELFLKRLEKSFDAFGLKATAHCILLPRLDQRRFIAAIGACDIVLDSIGWSGCNSTLESLQHGLPIVTLPNASMRSRHTSAILRMMGVTETTCSTVDEYVTTATRLGLDVSWRMTVKAKMVENVNRVYRDRACILALEDFLSRVARNEK